jgi:glycerol uptake facilitator-like aquaporin
MGILTIFSITETILNPSFPLVALIFGNITLNKLLTLLICK